MGNTDSKLNFRKAVVQLTSKTQVNSKIWLEISLNICNWGTSFFILKKNIFIVFGNKMKLKEKVNIFKKN